MENESRNISSNEENQSIDDISEEEENKKKIEFGNESKNIFIAPERGFIYTLKTIWFSIKHPKQFFQSLFKHRSFLIYMIAILSGLVGAGAAWVFSNYISLTRILFYGLIYKNAGIAQLLMIVLLPTLAAAITAPILNRWAPEAKGHGIPEVMESIIFEDGYIKTTTPYLKMALSGICIGGGLSLGREGPIAQIGGGFSSFLGRKLGLRGRSIKTVVVCGLVAGISATFNAPIGAALFGLEILIISLSADQLIPIILSSLIANIVGRFILDTGSKPIFEIPTELTQIAFNDYVPYLHWFLLLGVFAGFVAILYTKSLGLIEKIVHNVKRVPTVIWPIAGGFLTGLIGLLSPRVLSQDLHFSPIGGEESLFSIDNVEGIPRIFGVGYETITALFANDPIENSWTMLGGGVIVVLVLLLLLKILATGFSVGTGNSGGVFAPALVIGATTGYGFAYVLNSVIPTLNFTKQDFALFTLVGFAAVFSGSSRAVLTMIFMASEMTHSYHTFIPLMLTCTISYFMSKATMKENIYTQKLLIRGINISMAGPTDLLETYKVKDMMTTDVICVPEHMKMSEFDSLVNTMDHLGYPIINLKGEFLGIVTTTHLKLALNNNQMDSTVLEAGNAKPYVLYPDETVNQAMSLLYRSDIGRIAILDNPRSRNLVGIVSNSDVLKCLEMQRLKDLEERRFADKKLAKAELQMVEKAVENYPELAEKVKVISRKEKHRFTEKDLLAFLREECEEKVLKDCLEKKYKEHITTNKKKIRTKRRERRKKNGSAETSDKLDRKTTDN
ncbi:MAG: chloride channel protein [Candidatus Heimdallarchaeota archaeon]